MDSPQQSQPMVCPTHTTHYILMVILGMLVGTVATFVFFASTPTDQENTYQAGFNAAKKLVEDSGIVPPIQALEDIRSISGTVTSTTVTMTSGQTISLRVRSMNPFDDALLPDRTVTISPDTVITLLSQKDPETLQSEFESFMKSQTPGAIPPDPYTRTVGTLADITEGDIINVSAEENIKSLKTFTASEIIVQPKLTVDITN